MPYRITKTFEFEAAHHLEGLPLNHPCARPHGHSYKVELVLESDHLSGAGFVRDFGELRTFGTWLLANFDHQDLNAVITDGDLAIGNPTAENLSRFLFWKAKESWPEVRSCTVQETRTGSATYYET